ncbi:MAG: tRNA uracil 4-sulfurtransferase ThiI [Rhodothermus sp.]|nr:tRNA uracil 4-sulfurtransferase ThiI [Rhodothermus sp.]
MTARAPDTHARALLFLRPASELTLKSSRTRRRFQQLLVRNLKDALRSQHIPFRFQGSWSWFLIETETPLQALEALRHVPGIGPIMPVELVTGTSLEEIVQRGAEVFAERVRNRRFAVRARRRGDHPYRSRDIEVELGAALRPFAERVDLTNPEVTVYVEVREDRAYFYTTILKGLGGLPLGSQGQALVLLSGGFDSAVAAWLAMRRGVAVDYLFCNLGGKAYERAVLQVAKVLADAWSFGTRPRFYSVDFGPVVDEMRRHVRPAYWQVVLKRLMYRAGEAVARQTEASALITGESLGQVSSQTLKNLQAIEAGTSLPVLRPLLTYDKEEIIHLARKIGTATLSERVREYCALTPDRPVTATRPEAVDAEMARLDLSVLEQAVAQAAVYDMRALSASELVTPYLFIEEIPEDAEVIDCQSEALYAHWHYPGARHMDPWQLLQQFRHLDRNRVYVLYCPRGLQSAYVAEVMQREGYEAYSFKGGLPALKAYAQRRGIEVPEL